MTFHELAEAMGWSPRYLMRVADRLHISLRVAEPEPRGA